MFTLLDKPNQFSKKKKAGAYNKLLLGSSKSNHLNAYDQEGNQPGFSIYMGHQFHHHWHVKTGAEIL